LCLERATIAGRQGASEDRKIVAQPTQLNMNCFLANGIPKLYKLLSQLQTHDFVTKKTQSKRERRDRREASPYGVAALLVLGALLRRGPGTKGDI
jgi:hypothetical protein